MDTIIPHNRRGKLGQTSLRMGGRLPFLSPGALLTAAVPVVGVAAALPREPTSEPSVAR
jgi:hypothetical protein